MKLLKGKLQDNNLEQKIVTEINDRINADNVLTGKISKEVQDRTEADSALDLKIDALRDENSTEHLQFDSRIDILETRLDGILDGAKLDLDSFKEIVDYINSIDLEMI